MKKNILIILCILLATNLSAQKSGKDFRYYKSSIDNIASYHSVDTIRRDNIRLSFQDADLSLKEQKQIVYAIRRLFEQDRYSNLHWVGYELLDIMWCTNQNPLEIRKMLMETFLQYYFYPEHHASLVEIHNSESRFDYTNKAKKRIREILEGKKTKEEYVLHFLRNRTIYNKPQIGWDEAARIMKTREMRNTTVLKQLRDSILETYVVRDSKREFEAARIKPNLIKMIGLLEMTECIPVLKQKLAECVKTGDCLYGEEKACRYALARLGDEEQRQYILETMNIHNFARQDFLYFKDDEIIWRYIDVGYLPGEKISVLSDVDLDATLLSMNDVYPFIKNVPPELICPTESYNIEVGGRWAKLFYEWLMENRDHIEFNFEGEKKWFWPHY
ncbi:MAG: hypothetical protein LBG80_10525 [Bacteroidales bacterium]|jgi:hypothetical protein|nr:hypothetical protein [Bacteroidales bacterium]